MTETEIAWPAEIDGDTVACLIDFWIASRQLICSMRSPLAKHPGCTHWHVKAAATRGTLEITLWPSQRRIWVSIRTNRAAEWMNGLTEMLSAEIARHSANV